METPTILKPRALRNAAWGLAWLLLLFTPRSVCGYTVPTHEDIGETVAEVILNLDPPKEEHSSPAFDQRWLEFKRRLGIDLKQPVYLSTTAFFPRPRTPAAWIAFGNGAEDAGSALSAAAGTARYLNHLYNPVWDAPEYGDHTDETSAGQGGMRDHDQPWNTGKSAMKWAFNHPDNSLNACALNQLNDPLEDRYSWTAARCYFYKALAEREPDRRDVSVGRTFRSLGHLIHLLQDMGQPAHTRNDAHASDSIRSSLGWHDRIESWTGENIKKNPTMRLWAEQVKQNFFSDPALPFHKRLLASGQPTIEDFFDVRRQLEPVDSQQNNLSFGFDRIGSLSKGMAEFTSHNFFSEDTLKRTDNWHSFLFPEVDQRTCGTPAALLVPLLDPAHKRRGCLATEFIDPLPLNPPLPPPVVVAEEWLTKQAGPLHWWEFGIWDGHGEVFHQNVIRLLPKVMAYSAGAIDFFFRGKFDVKITFQGGVINGGTYFLNVTNMSGEPLGPGKLSIYYENAAHKRSRVPGYEEIMVSGPVPDGGVVPELTTFELPPGLDASNGFMLVYRGQLGAEVANEAKGNVGAVIGQRFNLLRTNIVWEPNSDQDLYFRGPDGSIISYYRRNTSFGQLDFDNIGGKNPTPENITLKDLSAPGDYAFLINYYRDWWKERQSEYDPNTGQWLRCVSAVTGEPMPSCPLEDPVPPGQNTPDDFDPCPCTTKIHNTVRTYFNSVTPVRIQEDPVVAPSAPNGSQASYTQQHTDLRIPTYNGSDGAALNGNGEGKVDDSWWVVQAVCVQDDGQIFIGGVNGVPTTIRYNATTKKCAPSSTTTERSTLLRHLKQTPHLPSIPARPPKGVDPKKLWRPGRVRP